MFEKEKDMYYSDKIRLLRTDSGMSQEQLASQLCVTRQTVSKWEQGINQPDIDTIKKLAEIFGVTADEIIGASHTVSENSYAPLITKLRRASGTLFGVNILFAIFCAIAAVILCRTALIPRSNAPGFGLWILQNEVWIKLNNDIDIAVLNYNTDALYFLPAFALFVGIASLCRLGCKNYFKAQVVALSVMLAAQIATCAAMFSVTLAHATFTNLTDVLVFAMLLSADLLAVMGLACHPKLLPQNEIMGFRTSFTLSDPVAWRKVNGVAATVLPAALFPYIIVILAIPSIRIGLIGLTVGFVAAVVGALVPATVYHEILRKRARSSR